MPSKAGVMDFVVPVIFILTIAFESAASASSGGRSEAEPKCFSCITPSGKSGSLLQLRSGWQEPAAAPVPGAVIFPSADAQEMTARLPPGPNPPCQQLRPDDDTDINNATESWLEVSLEPGHACVVIHKNNEQGDVVQRTMLSEADLELHLGFTKNGCRGDLKFEEESGKFYGCICRTDKCNINSSPAMPSVGILGALSLAALTALVSRGSSASSRFFFPTAVE